MSDTPKFEVIDRRKIKAEEEQEKPAAPRRLPLSPRRRQPAGPRLVVNESKPSAEPRLRSRSPAEERDASRAHSRGEPRAEGRLRRLGAAAGRPGARAESRRGRAAARQLRAPGAAVLRLRHDPDGSGRAGGQRPRVDILGARTTIDLLGVLAEKTRGNLTEAEDRTLQTVLFEVRMAFLELTSMITLQGMQPPQPPPPGKR
jgi:hypothetical protein